MRNIHWGVTNTEKIRVMMDTSINFLTSKTFEGDLNVSDSTWYFISRLKRAFNLLRNSAYRRNFFQRSSTLQRTFFRQPQNPTLGYSLLNNRRRSENYRRLIALLFITVFTDHVSLSECHVLKTTTFCDRQPGLCDFHCWLVWHYDCKGTVWICDKQSNHYLI